MAREFKRAYWRDGILCVVGMYTTIGVSSIAIAQDPYVVAADHYHLAFENKWARATLVTYQPHSSAPVHEHPATPLTIYVYITQGGRMQFHHVEGEEGVAGATFERQPVKAGAIRIAAGTRETHSVDYLGDEPTQYARLELRTEVVDAPIMDLRLQPVSMDPSQSALKQRFENGQFRILEVMCADHQRCPVSAHPEARAIVVTLSGEHLGQIEWNPRSAMGPVEQIRIELKTKPASEK